MIKYLFFSDSAKYADIARSIVTGKGFGANFTFWDNSIFGFVKQNIISTHWMSPVTPFSIAAFFKIFGITDFAVLATSMFYFILTLVFVYLLAGKIFKSKLVRALSTLAVGFNYSLINYATSGASESPFMFEIVAALYFASFKKKRGTVVAFLLLVLMYFTRPQAFIYIAGIVLYWLFMNFKPKTASIAFVGVGTIGLLFDYFVLMPLTGKYFIYSVIYRSLTSAFNQTSVASDALRGATGAVGGIAQTLKNIFYNLYNFYKALPDIINPYLFGIFTLGLFLKSKTKAESSFKIASVFMIIVTLLVTADSIPFYRYIHPIIPFVYIMAVGTLVGILETQILNKKFVVIVSTFLILLFGVGQTLGVLLLDSRFEAKTHNVGKAPVYVELSKILKANTEPNQIVITNLDTWGSWYGERKTVWFPLEPKQLIDPSTGKIPFDAIYLTSYLIDDENYYMGNSWRMIFENPTDSKKWTCDGCSEIAKEFKFKGNYSVSASDNYDRIDATSVLFVKK